MYFLPVVSYIHRTKQCLFDVLQDPTIGQFSFMVQLCPYDIHTLCVAMEYPGKDELHSLHYHLIPGDLRNVTTLGDQLLSTGLDTR